MDQATRESLLSAIERAAQKLEAVAAVAVEACSISEAQRIRDGVEEAMTHLDNARSYLNSMTIEHDK